MTMPKFEQLYIIFDGPPGPNTAHFVEVETDTGVSVRAGEWKQQGGYWTLGPFCESDKITEAFEAGKRDAIPGWISVDDRLPEPYNRNSRSYQGVLAFVKDDENIYGGRPMVLFYGSFAFIDDSIDLDHPDADEDGMISRFGWHYERDSEGEYDSLIFDMNDKVTHWMPLPAAPKGEE